MPTIKLDVDSRDSAPIKIVKKNGDRTAYGPVKIEIENMACPMQIEIETMDRPVKNETEIGDCTGVGGTTNMKIEGLDFEGHSVSATRKQQKKVYGPSSRPAKFSFVKPILHEHRRRLVRLIDKLAKRHSWRDASGALSVLLKGTPRGCSVIEDRKHFLVAMELLRRFPNSQDYTKRIKQAYEVWMIKLAWARKSPEKKHLIQMELTLFCLTQGSIREAYNTMKFLVQDRESSSDPHVHLIHGMASYQLWYSGLPKEMQLEDFDVFMQTEASGMALGDDLAQQVGSVGSSAGCNSVDTQYTEIYARGNSESSIGNDKTPMDLTMYTSRKQFHSYHHGSEFYVNGSAVIDETRNALPNLVSNLAEISIFYAHGLDACLLPIRLPQSAENLNFKILSLRQLMNDHYVDAVKHLRIALHSDPPVLSALHPLIQLLLLGDQVEEALKELEEFSNNTKSILPFRYSARLLECICSSQYAELARQYEKILEIEPTCVSSLQRLIKMQISGAYSTARLLEWIAMHLDHTDGLSSIWGEFASCLLKIQSHGISEYEEDALSTSRPKNLDCAMPSLSTPSRKVPIVLVKGEARRRWIYRCKWWSKRHFNRAIFKSEFQAGEWQLLTSKAACASHLYGPKFPYVREVLSSQWKGDEELMSALWRHVDNSLKLLDALDNT